MSDADNGEDGDANSRQSGEGLLPIPLSLSHSPLHALCFCFPFPLPFICRLAFCGVLNFSFIFSFKSFSFLFPNSNFLFLNPASFLSSRSPPAVPTSTWSAEESATTRKKVFFRHDFSFFYHSPICLLHHDHVVAVVFHFFPLRCMFNIIKHSLSLIFSP